MSQVYNTTGAPKLCVIFRDNPRVRIQPLRTAFSGLQFKLLERNVASGETDHEVLQFFDHLAADATYEGYGCLVVAMAGCYNAMDGWGVNVSGLDIDFDHLLEPFTESLVWRCKPKLFIVQYENEGVMASSTVCCDAGLLAAGSAAATAAAAANGLPAFADTALVLGYGGDAFNGVLCNTVTEYGRRLEFHPLMTLLNKRVMQLTVEHDLAPMAVGFASQLTKKLFLAQL